MDPSTPAASEGGTRPREFINASRTNIALPFSKINLEEPSAELTELAALVLDLIEALERAAPKEARDELSNLFARAEALLARLR